MTTTTDNEFGAGIFDESTPAPGEETQEIKLTDREIAIASGEDPDAPPEDDSEGDQPAEDDQEPAGDEGASDGGDDDPEVDDEPAFSASDQRLAQLYGVSEDEMEKLGTPEALQNFISAIEKRGVKPGETGDGASPSSTDDDRGTGDAGESGGLDALLKDWKPVDLSEFRDPENPLDEDSERLVNTVDSMQKVVEALIKDRNERPAPQVTSDEAAQAAANARMLHDTLDTHADIYGQSMKDGEAVQVTKAQQEAREKVIDTAETIYAGYVARGAEPPAVKDIIQQAIQAAHGDKLTKRVAEGRKTKLKRQSSMRRSTGKKAASAPRNMAIDSNDPSDIANHPSIAEFWQRTQEENGAI